MIHGDSPEGFNHQIHNFIFADAASRLALIYVETDVGKVAYQLDDKTFWLITEVISGVATFAALGNDANFAATMTTALAGKQATLVSASNIKTINGSSLLGSGDLAVSGSSGVNVAMNDQITGTTATIVGSIRLPAGTYTPSAMLGCGNPTYAATLLLKDGATTKDTIGGTAGGIAWRTGAGFTLAATTDIDIYIYANNASATAYLRSLTL